MVAEALFYSAYASSLGRVSKVDKVIKVIKVIRVIRELSGRWCMNLAHFDFVRGVILRYRKSTGAIINQ